MTDKRIADMVDYRLRAISCLRKAEQARRCFKAEFPEVSKMYYEMSEDFERMADTIAEDMNQWREQRN